MYTFWSFWQLYDFFALSLDQGSDRKYVKIEKKIDFQNQFGFAKKSRVDTVKVAKSGWIYGLLYNSIVLQISDAINHFFLVIMELFHTSE